MKSELGQNKEARGVTLRRRSKAGKQQTSFITSHNDSDKGRKTDVKDDSCGNVKGD